MTNKEIEQIALESLKQKYYDLVNWEPDYEEYGIQFGPSEEEIKEAADRVKELDPNWKSEEEKLEGQRRQINEELERHKSYVLKFGKHKGRKIGDLLYTDGQYLHWLMKQDLTDDDLKYSLLFIKAHE